MLGSLSEADDAVQETWLRLSQSDSHGVENLRAWLTTIVARISLNMLRARASRREERLDILVPDPVVSSADGVAPDQQALVADAVGLALLVVLQTLAPDERLAFVLHDMFAVPFAAIAPLVDRTPTAARKLASRARQRVRGRAPVPDHDLARPREAVDAFFAAARDGDFDRLVAVLDPEVVLRTDGGPGSSIVTRGARDVAARALGFARISPYAKPVLVNGAAGVVVAPDGQPFSVMGFTVVGLWIVEIDAIIDSERLRHLELSALDG
jgi:RNA polymerase sigma-70 factor (ECF subfamily)